MGENFDFICQTSFRNGTPSSYERFKGAFDLAYKDKSGSIYVLDGKNFQENMTAWSAEVVSTFKENAIQEIYVPNVEDYLRTLEREGKLKIYMFPSRPEGAPTDKGDLIQKGVDWTVSFGEKTLEKVEQYHPDILDRVLEGLKQKNYEFKSEKWISNN